MMYRAKGLVEDLMTAFTQNKGGESDTISVGYGFEGLRDVVQRSDNVFSAYPATKAQSRYSKKEGQKGIDSKTQSFLDSHEQVVLVDMALQESEQWIEIQDVINTMQSSKLGLLGLSNSEIDQDQDRQDF